MGFSQLKKWDAARYGELKLETLKSILQPKERYKISYDRYAPGQSFSCSMRAGEFYVISGSVTLSHRGTSENLSIEAGQYASFPEGTYDVRVGEDAPVELLKVWDLGELFGQMPQESESS